VRLEQKQIRAYKRNGNGIIEMIAVMLKRGEPTLFRYEASARYGIRIALCLRGHSWPVADSTAAYVVRRALNLIGARRPAWYQGQPEYTQYGVTKIEHSHCINCGRVLPEGHSKYCSKICGNAFRNAIGDLDRQAAERVRKLAYWEAKRAAAELRECERCGFEFKPAYPEQRFCSRKCSGSRSRAEKMNGKHHPWMTKTGAGAVNGAAISSPISPRPERRFARPDARTPFSTASQPTPEPRPELS
jgi:predicted nucleic acid-binding Zn ribbon protein